MTLPVLAMQSWSSASTNIRDLSNLFGFLSRLCLDFDAACLFSVKNSISQRCKHSHRTLFVFGLTVGEPRIPPGKDGSKFCSRLDDLNLATATKSRAPETAFSTVSSDIFQPEAVLALKYLLRGFFEATFGVQNLV